MVLDRFRLDGRTALVTGAARGLGSALAIGLAEAGAEIIALDRNSLADTTQRVNLLGRDCHALVHDLQGITAEAADALVQECVRVGGRLDILVNNAGIIRRAPALDYTRADWDAVISVNLSGSFFLAQAVARHLMHTGGGKIINMASMLSFQGGVNVAAYAAAKSGIAGLTRALANEWARHGINVNAIAPGYMVTDLTAPLRADPDQGTAILNRIPAGRWGEPEDLKGAVVFLASDASSYIHGTILPVDGGWLSW